MKNRPSIPSEIERDILIECGHRCAACGIPSPIERAHIIPWHKTKEHSSENLICLCANCHEQADKENWGSKTLKEYKKRPWVNRQYNSEGTKNVCVSKSRIRITIDMERDDFSEKNQKWFKNAISGFLDIMPDSVKIVKIEYGSINILLELPKTSIDELVTAHKRKDPELTKFLYPITLSNVQKEVDTQLPSHKINTNNLSNQGEKYMRTLRGFPEEFSPIVIVTGDRREIPPVSKGDVLAYSVSNTDIMYMNFLHKQKLDLNSALVLSDKQFVTDSDSELAQKFGNTHILVIGSPAVNLLARRINEQCSFRFSISDETKKELQEQDDLCNEFIFDEEDLYIYHQCLEGILDEDSIVSRFTELDPHMDELREKARKIIPVFKKTKICRDLHAIPRPFKYLMHKLDKPGVFDTLSGNVRGEALGPYRDFGIITITDNPFSQDDKYSIVYVAGVHGPGTALGLKMLSDKAYFNNHPFGGVYDVKLSRFATYFEKIQKSVVRWDTPGYEELDYIDNPVNHRKMTAFVSSPSSKEDVEQIEFNKQIKLLLENIFLSRGINLRTEGPYTLTMSGRLNFWQNILDFEKKCDFIVHDMTDCRRGVMVEIGFSFGTRRKFFLIWNVKKRPVLNWKQIIKPSLLPVTHIEQISTDDVLTLKNSVSTKILERVLHEEHLFDCGSCESISEEPNNNSAYIYSREPNATSCLNKMLKGRKILILEEEESHKELRVCRICQVMKLSKYVIIQLGDDDPDSFIVLGMAKAMNKRTMTIALAKYKKSSFAWANESKQFHLDTIEDDLKTPLAKFVNY